MVYFELGFWHIKAEKTQVYEKPKIPKMINCQGFSKETFFFGLFLENTNSVPLSILRISWRIFVLKQIFIIIGYSAEIACKVLQKYCRWLKIDHNGEISVSRKLLVQSPRKFQNIYYFGRSIELHKNYENIFCW